MKKLLFSLFMMGFAFTANAQFELKLNPVAALFEVGLVSLEISNLNDAGGQLDIIAADGGAFVYGAGKYYLNPKYGADRFGIGAFIGAGISEGSDSGFGLGFLGTYKVVSKQRIVFEIALGLGRDFTGDIEVLPYFNLNVGYRFLNQKNK